LTGQLFTPLAIVNVSVEKEALGFAEHLAGYSESLFKPLHLLLEVGEGVWRLRLA